MCVGDDKVIETYSNSDGKKITKAEFEKAIKGAHAYGNGISSSYTIPVEFDKSPEKEPNQKVMRGASEFITNAAEENELSKKVTELEDKLKRTGEAFDYVLCLLVEVLESLKPK